MPTPPVQTKMDHILRLLDSRDPRVFAEGGCHIFAMALQRRFGYRAYGLRKQNHRLSHVYCLGKSNAVDAKGKRPEDELLFDWQDYEGGFSRMFSLARRIELDFDNLREEHWQTHGLLSEPLFVDSGLRFASDYIAANESKYANA
jgi:hypothetical protein